MAREVRQRVKGLENDQGLLWDEVRALRDRITRGWGATLKVILRPPGNVSIADGRYVAPETSGQANLGTESLPFGTVYANSFTNPSGEVVATEIVDQDAGANIKAARSATADLLLALDGSAKFPASTITLASPSGLSLAGGLQLDDSVAGAGLTVSSKVLAVGAGDGIDVAADAIAVDVTDFIDTAYGLTESTNDIRINAGAGLEFDSGALQVDSSVVRTTRQVIAGSGLTGGGALSSNVTLNVGAGDGIDVAADAIAVDVTDFIDTAYGLTESTNDIRINAGAGLEFDSGALQVDSSVVRTTRQVIAGSGLTGGGALSSNVTLNIGAGDGIDVAADAIAVDVTDFIDTAYGLTESTNNIRINAGAGLEFDSGALQVDVGADFTWTGTHTFQVDVQLNCNLDFLGPRSITTTTGSLTLNPSVSCLIEANTSVTGNCTVSVGIRAGGIYVGAIGNYPDTGDVHYESDLRPIRGVTTYTGYAFVPLAEPLTSTSWDGDSFSDVTGSTQMDLSAAFGAPVGVKAVLFKMIARDSVAWGTSDLYFACGPSSTEWAAAGVRPAGGDVLIENTAVVPCDANGDVWYRINASGASTMDVWLQIWGYFI